jgi:hypothetical protein
MSGAAEALVKLVSAVARIEARRRRVLMAVGTITRRRTVVKPLPGGFC